MIIGLLNTVISLKFFMKQLELFLLYTLKTIDKSIKHFLLGSLQLVQLLQKCVKNFYLAILVIFKISIFTSTNKSMKKL